MSYIVFGVIVIILLVIILLLNAYQVYCMNTDKFKLFNNKNFVPVMPEEKTGYDTLEPRINTLPILQNENLKNFTQVNDSPYQYKEPLLKNPPMNYNLMNKPIQNIPPIHPIPPDKQFNQFTQSTQIPYIKEEGMFTESVKKNITRYPVEGLMSSDDANSRFFRNIY